MITPGKAVGHHHLPGDGEPPGTEGERRLTQRAGHMPRKAVSPARMMTGSMMNPMANAPAQPAVGLEVPHDGDVAEDAQP